MTAVTDRATSSCTLPYQTIPVTPFVDPDAPIKPKAKPKPKPKRSWKNCSCLPSTTACKIIVYLNLIFNLFHTITMCAFIYHLGVVEGIGKMGLSFTFDDMNTPQTVEAAKKSFLSYLMLLQLINLGSNAIWLIINVVCLAGVHLKHPSLVKMYVGFATFRFALTLTGLFYLGMSSVTYTRTAISYSVDLGLTGYFIIAYYFYVIQLDQELIGIKLSVKNTPPLKNAPMPEIVPTPVPNGRAKGVFYIQAMNENM